VEFLRSKATEYAGEYNPEPSKIFKAAAKEIARLRRRLAEARLTDAERAAVEMAVAACDVEQQLNVACGGRQSFAGLWADRAATLRGLLERTRNGPLDGRETVR
jgi:hypothetical protein